MKRVLGDGNGGWRKVPMSVFLTVITALLGVIGALVSWDRGAVSERAAVVLELKAQFVDAAEFAARSAAVVHQTQDLRMDRIQRDLGTLRDDLTRHMDADNQRFAERRR